jgi:hypothetical protein
MVRPKLISVKNRDCNFGHLVRRKASNLANTNSVAELRKAELLKRNFHVLHDLVN